MTEPKTAWPLFADAIVQTLALAAGEISEAGYASWLEANSSRRARSARR